MRMRLQSGTVKSNITRYTWFLHDVPGLADPRSLLTGMHLFNILDHNLVSHIYQTMNGNYETIYKEKKLYSLSLDNTR